VRARLVFTVLQQHRADPAPGVGGIDEEGADLGGVRSRIEPGGVPPAAGIAAEQRGAKAPTPAADDPALVLHRAPFFDHEIGPVFEQLGVDAERAAQGTLNLRRAIIVCAQAARRPRDQRL